MQIPKDEFPDLVTREKDSVIYCCDKPLKTFSGKDLCHKNDRLLRHIISDLLIMEEENNYDIRAISLLEYEIDHLDGENDRMLDHFTDLVHKDPFYLLKSGTHPAKNDTTKNPDEKFNELSINLTFWTVSSILKTLNSFISDNLYMADVVEGDEEPVLLLMKQYYNNTSKSRKAAIYMLWSAHGSGMVLPFMLVSELITPAEYAKGVVALNLNGQLPAFPGEEIMRYFPEVPVIQHQDFNHIYHDAVVIKDYLSINESSQSSDQKLEDRIKGGENEKVEFKSTFRWDLKAGKTNSSVERTSLKSICGFLNSTGGTLLIGIRDDGTTEGIESDRFTNEDKFLLHLWTLIRTCLGRDVSPYIHTRIEKRDEKSVCIVECSVSPRPVFLRQPGFDEEFYIRLGPGSAALDISEALKYIADHFKS